MPETDGSYLRDGLLLLLAAVVAVPLFQRLRLGPVLGYLAAGMIIGPHGMQFVADAAGTRSLADLGVVFLLFTIGLEMTLARLRSIGTMVYSLGVAQILVTAAVIGAVVMLFGYGSAAAVTIGGALAMSSTAIVLQVLNEHGQLKSRFGQIALAILLVQDLAVGPLLVLLEVLARSKGDFDSTVLLALGLAAVKAAVAITVIFVVGRLLLRPALRTICEARSPEVFAATTLLVALGTSWATEHAGLSMAFGAFLAGMLIAETEYRHQVAADIEPFRGILLGLFFMTVGMTIDVSLALANFALVVGLVVALLAGKAAIIVVLSRLFRFSLWRALRLGGVLSQGGEFAFVLFGIAAASKVMPDELANLLVVVVAVSMALTPVVVAIGGRLIAHVEQRFAVRKAASPPTETAGHVLVVGFGEVGRIVARMLKAYGVTYIVLDMSPRRISEGRAAEEPVFYGDAGLVSVLRAAGAERARSVVVATGDPAVTLRVFEALRSTFPALPVFARVADEQSAIAFRREGVTDAVPETTEVGLRLAGAALHSEIERLADPGEDAVA